LLEAQPVHYHWYVYSEWATLGGVTALSVLRGASAERFGAFVILAVNLASDIVIAMSFPSVPQMTLFWLDMALAIGLLAITFRFGSLWLGAAMLLQSVILFGHAMALGGDEISKHQFMYMNNAVSWLMYVCLFGATVMSWRIRRRSRSIRMAQVSDVSQRLQIA
jgi:hypothetical protein